MILSVEILEYNQLILEFFISCKLTVCLESSQAILLFDNIKRLIEFFRQNFNY